MLFNQLKIGHRLGWAFGLLIFLFSALNIVNSLYMQNLSEHERNLYKHPFAVSTAMLRIDGNIVRMHRSMKDVALAEHEKDLEEAIAIVADLEGQVFQDLDLVYERFLGKKEKVDLLRRLFRNWKPIRDNVIDHMRMHEKREAAVITKGQGAEYINQLNEQINSFILFARNKADAFHQKAESDHQEALLVSYLLLLLGVVVSIILALWNTRSIVHPIDLLISAANKIADGDLSSRVGFKGKDELGRLAKIFDRMATQTEELVWIKSTSSELTTQMQKANNLRDLAQLLISRLTPLLEGGHGVIYLINDDTGRYELFASYGYEHRKNLSNSFAPGERLVGQCVLEKQPIILDSVPDDYIRISSGLGESKPLNIYAFPVLSQSEVLCVVEIASFKRFTESQLKLLKESSQAIALILENQRRSHRTEELLRKTQTQSDELSTQQEELRQANEAMKKQTESLKASEEELRIQQDNLEATNRHLEEKTNRLEDEQEAREQARLELEVKADELEKASQYKSEFLANMSHELRTPLNSLLILAKSFADNQEGNLTANQIEAASIIHGSGEDLLRLINDILDLAKIEAGRMEMNSETMDIQPFAQSIQNQFHHMAVEKGLEFSVSIDPALPAHFHTDWERIGQIIKNLISNALKFTKQGNVSVHFQPPDFSSQPSPPTNFSTAGLAVHVTDTGIGIPEDKMNLIFEAFHQGDGTTSRHFGGTGLGLSISRELAHALGGHLGAHSKIGKGSTFTLFLPPKNISLTTTPNTPVTTAISPQQHKPIPTPSPSPTVVTTTVEDDRATLKHGDSALLIIEDDAKFARTVYMIFRDKGFKCLVASDGETGLSLAIQYRPIGIILDLGLPDIDGWSVLSRLKEDPDTRHIPVHIVSGQDNATSVMQKGAVGFLNKPVSSSHLEQALERMRHFHADGIRELLVVEDNPDGQKAIIHLLSNETINITVIGTGSEALALLQERHFDCMILDLGLPDMSGFDLLDQIRDHRDLIKPPVVVYSGKELTKEEHLHLQRYTDSIVIKGAKSAERLLDEVVLFLHSVEDKLPESQRRMLRQAHNPEIALRGKTILLVDDDVRNTFALARILEIQGLHIVMAPSGKKALELLEKDNQIELVLMDIMMPGMDGYQAIREIRKKEKTRKLPIIAVTAKAMLEDRQKCLDAGANDYLSKPIDTDRLLSMMRVWLY